MRCICLIPTINKPTLNLAIESAIRDGWEIILLEDILREGAVVTREKLFNMLPSSGIVRYLDDDDELLQHRTQVLNVFNENKTLDILYNNYSIEMPNKNRSNIKLFGNPVMDILRIHPWSWIARIESLHNLQQKIGYIWNPTYRFSEGGFCFLSFIKNKLNIQHVPINSYLYHPRGNPPHIVDNPMFNYYQLELQSALELS